MVLFTVKYAPHDSGQIVGQEKSVSALKQFILDYKRQKKKAAILDGPTGSGKTAAVYALARELHYELVELNSSDFRDEATVKSILGAALGQQSLFLTPKILLVDEVDNISGTSDRGCLPALLTLMEKSTYPLIFTANDLSDAKFKSLLKSCYSIPFPGLSWSSILIILQTVCQQEHIFYDEKALSALARHADGDARAALIDLNICTTEKKITLQEIHSLSDRKRTQSILNALTIIFKASSIENALPALEDVDMDLQEVLLWIDENLSKEYNSPRALAKAYEHLARADVFQGRIIKRQYWRFLVYINNLLTAGISSAKEEKNSAIIPYQRTQRFLQMWIAKQRLGKKKGIAAKLAKATHTSTKAALQQVPYLQIIFRRTGGEEISKELKLEEEEVEWLRG